MKKGIRRQGRELALKIIYCLQDQDASSLEVVFDDFWSNFRFRDDVLGDPHDEFKEPISLDVRDFAEDLVRGVADHLEKIDEVIETFSTNWALDRMARVDLSLLRLGTYEILFRSDVPTSVAINEAIEVGKIYGTKETPSFVNGLLDKISRTHRPAGK